jgi:hypothetical protein
MLFPIVSDRFFSAFTPFGYVFDRPLIVSAKALDLLVQIDGSTDCDTARYHAGNDIQRGAGNAAYVSAAVEVLDPGEKIISSTPS